MGPNTTAFIPQQVFHEYMNKGPEVCEFLQYFSPSGPEEEYRAWQQANEEPAQAEPQKQVATTPQEIIRGARSSIPGSPDTHIDSDVKEGTSSASESNPSGKASSGSLPALKLRSESSDQDTTSPQAHKPVVKLTPPTPATHSVDSLRVGQALSTISAHPSATATDTHTTNKPAAKKATKKTSTSAKNGKAH